MAETNDKQAIAAAGAASQAPLHIGIDVGSTTVKVAVLDDNNEILYSCYRRHHADIRATIVEVVGEAAEQYPATPMTIAITGSGGLLLAQQLLDAPDIAVAQKGADLPERHIQRAQVADGVEHLKLPRPVVAVAGRGVGVFRRKQADGLIVAQAAHAQVKQLRHVADGKELLRARHVTPPPARAGRAGAARETRSRR